MDRGFTQLAVELIALDKYEDETPYAILYGSITIGEVWRFAVLNRKEKKIIKGMDIFRFPDDIEQLFTILKGILTS